MKKNSTHRLILFLGFLALYLVPGGCLAQSPAFDKDVAHEARKVDSVAPPGGPAEASSYAVA